MDRLTIRRNGRVEVDWTNIVLERLAEYEDTGFSPWQLQNEQMYAKMFMTMPNCNTCINANCAYRPKVGEDVRWNCPFYKAESLKGEE